VSTDVHDLAALQGSWEQVDFEENGVSNPPDPHGSPGSLTTITQNQFAVRTAEGALLLEGSFELNASANPKAINWIDSIGPDAGKKLPAIYRLEGDRFIFIAADAGAQRPAEFRTRDGQTMRTFARRS
jgi:uncharacterized protein (TIGR03067 family)